MAERPAPRDLPALLANDPSIDYRGGVLPFLLRTVTDIGGDDISEYQQRELATPALLYDPAQGMARTGAMALGHIPVDPNVVAQTAFDAPLVGGLFSTVTNAVPRGAVLGANVFHGGPHRFAPEPDFPFGRPRLDKIGTGEGNQAYGYGFYSADAPGVATQYQKGVKDMGEVRRLNDEMSELAKVMDQDSGPGYRNFMSDKGRKAAQRYDELMAAREAVVSAPGTLYKLDIPDADVAKYLDWDKPLSEQPNIIKKLRAAGFQYFEDKKGGAFADFGDVNTATGKDVFDGLGFDFDEKGISEVLRKAGIPGLKYFDQGSRAGGEGTRNYVTWDQDVLNRSKMLERDGVTLGANKSPTAALPGLLDDTASRMQRARDMGFDVDLTRYHQTSPAAKKEIMKGGFDPSIIGARWSDPLMPDGVFMKSGKDELPGLTQGKQTQMPLMTRAQNTKTFQNRGELEDFLSKDKQWKKMRDKQTALQDDATKLYQAIDTGEFTEKDVLTGLFGFDPKEVNKLDDVEAFDAFDGVIRDMAGTTSAELRARATEVFKKKGFDSVSVAEDWGGPFGKTVTDTFIVFDEKMLRSPKAKFDPAKADSADLLAANPPTAALPGLLEQQYMDESERLLRDSQGLLGATQRRNNQLNALQQFYASGGV